MGASMTRTPIFCENDKILKEKEAELDNFVHQPPRGGKEGICRERKRAYIAKKKGQDKDVEKVFERHPCSSRVQCVSWHTQCLKGTIPS